MQYFASAPYGGPFFEFRRYGVIVTLLRTRCFEYGIDATQKPMEDWPSPLRCLFVTGTNGVSDMTLAKNISNDPMCNQDCTEAS